MSTEQVLTKSVNIHPGALLALANKHYGKGVDADMRGKSITDFDVLLHGADGPAVMRLVNLAVSRSPDSPITAEALPALAAEAFAQKVDLNFAGQPITDYSILFNKEYGFGRHVEQLLELARVHRPILCLREATSLI